MIVNFFYFAIKKKFPILTKNCSKSNVSILARTEISPLAKTIHDEIKQKQQQ